MGALTPGARLNDTNNASELPPGNGRGPIIPKSPNEALKPERVPEPPRRSRKARSQLVIFLNFVMTMVVFLCVIGIAGFYYMISAFQQAGPLEANTHFMVRPGNGLSEIATNLERNGIISDARIFRYVTATYLRKGDTLKAGEYEIKARASMKDVMGVLEEGKSILYSVVLPEGLTVRQMMLRLAEDTVLEGDLPSELPPEGSLRPDTYKFSRGSKRADIIQQMRIAQQKMVDQIWERRDPDLPIKTKEEFVVLASIVEKETGKEDERAHVASVFINRLQRGMRLQSDPTIVYGIFGGEENPPTGRSSSRTSPSRRPITPITSRACRRRRFPIPAVRHCRQWPIPGGPRISISWPTAPAGMCLRRRSRNTMPMFAVGAEWNPSVPPTPKSSMASRMATKRKSRRRATDRFLVNVSGETDDPAVHDGFCPQRRHQRAQPLCLGTALGEWQGSRSKAAPAARP